jgi:hypothetical protein
MATSSKRTLAVSLVFAGLLVGACGSPEPLPANPEPIEASSSGGDLDSLFEDEGIEPAADDAAADDTAADEPPAAE